MAKMIDVAKQAGVSLKTVSRVINGEPTVHDELRERVLNSIERLGYVPSPSARALRSSRSYQINFISNSSRNSFANRVLFGALRACHQLGYQLALDLIEPHEQNVPEFTDNWIKRIASRSKPEGIIVLPPLSLDKRFIEKLVDANIPVVSVGAMSVHDQQGSVAINDRAAAEEMTNHLIQKGHRRIAFVKGAEDQTATLERFEGYADALRGSGLTLDPALVFDGDFHLESGVSAGQSLLALSDRPTAVFSSNDEMAAGIIVAAQKMGVAIPAQLSVTGFDDNTVMRGLWPSLTTISQPLEQFGKTAVEILASMRGDVRNADAGKDRCLSYELIERNSVDDISTVTLER